MSKKKKPSAPETQSAPAVAPVAPGTNIVESAPYLRFAPYLLLVVVAAVYAASIGNDFVFFDDDKAILYNKAVLNPSLKTFFTGQNLGMYAPLTWIAYWIGYLLSAKEAWGYHLLGLIFHLVNTVLVWRVLNRLSGRAWLAFFVALMFGLHPIQTEAVSWAAALSTVLFATFWLSSLSLWVRWATAPHPTLSTYAISLILFILGCFSKSAAVTLPMVLLALSFLFFENRKGKLWKSTIPYFAFAMFFGFKTFATRAAEGHDIEASSAVYSLVDRFFMISQTFLFYPVKILAPLGFSIAYPFVKTDGVWPWTYYAAPLAILALVALVWWKARHNRDVLLGVALYTLPLLIMLPFRTVGSFELRSDRYAYLSCIGIFWLVGLALEWLRPVALRHGAIVGMAAALALLTWNQSQVWRDGVSLFKNCTDKTPEASLCQCNLAYNELIRMDMKSAIDHYSTALKYDPMVIEAYNGRGQAYFQEKKFKEAFADFDMAIKGGLSSPKLFLNRGKCLAIMNQPEQALPDLKKSIELEIKNPEAYFFKGSCEEKLGKVDVAVTDYSLAIQYNPNYLEPLVNRGLLLYKQGKYVESIADYTAALQLNPNLIMALNNRANAFIAVKNFQKALEDVNTALRANPEYTPAYATRAQIYMIFGENELAQADLAKANKIK